jgi:hypothetical protein
LQWGGGFFQTTAGLVVGFQQLLNASSQLDIASAGLIHESSAFLGSAFFKSGQEDRALGHG